MSDQGTLLYKEQFEESIQRCTTYSLNRDRDGYTDKNTSSAYWGYCAAMHHVATRKITGKATDDIIYEVIHNENFQESLKTAITQAIEK